MQIFILFHLYTYTYIIHLYLDLPVIFINGHDTLTLVLNIDFVFWTTLSHEFWISHPCFYFNTFFSSSSTKPFQTMLRKNLKAPTFRCPAKRRERTRSNTITDTIPGSFNESGYSVYPEVDKLIPILTISNILKIILVNSDNNGHCNHMNDIKCCKLIWTFLIPLRMLQTSTSQELQIR